MHRIVIDIPEGVDAHDAQQIVRDAIGEFIAHRTPVNLYVEDRYSAQDLTFRADKLADVIRRINIAGLLLPTRTEHVPDVELPAGHDGNPSD